MSLLGGRPQLAKESVKATFSWNQREINGEKTGERQELSWLRLGEWETPGPNHALKEYPPIEQGKQKRPSYYGELLVEGGRQRLNGNSARNTKRWVVNCRTRGATHI